MFMYRPQLLKLLDIILSEFYHIVLIKLGCLHEIITRENCNLNHLKVAVGMNIRLPAAGWASSSSELHFVCIYYT